MIAFILSAMLGCSEPVEAPEAVLTTPDEAAPPAEAPVPQRVTDAVAIADAIEKEPARADAILTEKGTTRAEFEATLYDIAADPELAAAYAKARQD